MRLNMSLDQVGRDLAHIGEPASLLERRHRELLELAGNLLLADGVWIVLLDEKGLSIERALGLEEEEAEQLEADRRNAANIAEQANGQGWETLG